MSRIFISYTRDNHSDAQLASELFATLAAAGHNVFQDRASLRVGHRWARQIQEHLEFCDYLVLLLSEAAAYSEMVAEEVRIAKQAQEARGVRNGILPVRVAYEGDPPYNLSAALAEIQYASWDSSADTTRLIQEILTAVLSPSSETHHGISWGKAAILPGGTGMPPGKPMAACNLIAPLEQAGGAMPDSPYYVRRHADALVEPERLTPAFALLIRGPRQVGKSSLLARILDNARRASHAVVAIDLQRFSYPTRADPERLLLEFCSEIEYQLTLPATVDAYWESNVRRDVSNRANRYVQSEVLPKLDGRKLVIGIDECDTLLGQASARMFFPLLRSWVNQARGRNPPCWAPFNLVMVVGTEPAMLIPDVTQSPFNVADPIELEDFSSSEVDELHSRYGHPLQADPLKRAFYEFLHGHPFLTRLALNQIAEQRWVYHPEDLQADSESGLFGDHLRTLLTRVCSAGLADSLRDLLGGRVCSHDHRRRLIEGGIVAERMGRVVARNRLYHCYFARVLNA